MSLSDTEFRSKVIEICKRWVFCDGEFIEALQTLPILKIKDDFCNQCCSPLSSTEAIANFYIGGAQYVYNHEGMGINGTWYCRPCGNKKRYGF